MDATSNFVVTTPHNGSSIVGSTVTMGTPRPEDEVAFEATDHLMQNVNCEMDELNVYVKTIISASVPNKEQNHSMKLLIDEKFSSVRTRLHELAYPKIGQTKSQIVR